MSPSARWPRRPDSHSGDAGSNPAGDAGPTRWPARLLGGARPGGRAHQHAPGGRVLTRACPLSPCPDGTGTSFRSWLTRFDSSQGDRQFAPVLAARRELARLVAPGSTPGRGSAGRDGPTRGSWPRSRRFESCPCIRDDPWWEVALIRPSARVRFPPSRPIWVWLNLVERRLREPETGGSIPPTQTMRDETSW